MEPRAVCNLRMAPRAGAWIETGFRYQPNCSQLVAPHAGAWIETYPFVTMSMTESPLAQGRGLKLRPATVSVSPCESPLAQGRGLKHPRKAPDMAMHARSPLAQGRGLKQPFGMSEL